MFEKRKKCWLNEHNVCAIGQKVIKQFSDRTHIQQQQQLQLQP